MSDPALFIGVVSYPGSRFTFSQGPEGLAAALEHAMAPLGLDCTVLIDSGNRFEDQVRPISGKDVQESLSRQLELHNAWANYLAPGGSFIPWEVGRRPLRWLRRLWQRIDSPAPSTIVRLLNIELAHQALLKQGIASGAPWLLILEDDAHADDVEDLASGLAGVLQNATSSVQFINVSESFSMAVLGIDHVFERTPERWAGSVNREVLAADRPVTNTVCAIAYRSNFAAEVLKRFDVMPMTPVLPIDWKLNAVLMEMFADGTLNEHSCWWLSPGPIDQLSMRGPE